MTSSPYAWGLFYYDFICVKSSEANITHHILSQKGRRVRNLIGIESLGDILKSGELKSREIKNNKKNHF